MKAQRVKSEHRKQCTSRRNCAPLARRSRRVGGDCLAQSAPVSVALSASYYNSCYYSLLAARCYYLLAWLGFLRWCGETAAESQTRRALQAQTRRALLQRDLWVFILCATCFYARIYICVYINLCLLLFCAISFEQTFNSRRKATTESQPKCVALTICLQEAQVAVAKHKINALKVGYKTCVFLRFSICDS